MPFFKGKRREDIQYNGLDESIQQQQPQRPPHQQRSSNGHHPSPVPKENIPSRPKLVFHCQQAHGSPTGIISGFTNVKELYQKIAECYDINSEDILFCTLNTHKVDMARLLGGQIGLDDFIFAHRKGRAKEIEITKTEDALGLTITDNGAGYAFIKRIKEGSVIDRLKHIEVGDHIEKIDGLSLVGKRHFEVAKMLKEIPKGTTFVMRVVEPLKAGFANIGPRTDPRSSTRKNYGSGKQTLRFKANGQAQVEDAHDDVASQAIEKINELLENFMGINDNDLATQIWDLAEGKSNTMSFAEAVDSSDLEAFGFTDDFIFDLWGVITDAKAGRLKKH
ncbi:UNVERIFIED_CONTAM: hypothetical protein RMT77_010556 [Armadillidium vulgare]